MHIFAAIYDPIQKFFFHYIDKVPAPLQPYAGWVLLLVAVLLYVWALVLMGRWAESKNQRFWLGFTLGLVNTPFLGSLMLAFMNDGGKAAKAATPRRRTRRRAPA